MGKRKYMVVARNPEVLTGGLKTGLGKVDFHKKTAKIIDDPALAREIDSEYGLKGRGDVWVERDERLENHSSYHDGEKVSPNGKTVHNYFFGSNSSFRRGWEHIFENPKKAQERGEEPEVECAHKERKIPRKNNKVG